MEKRKSFCDYAMLIDDSGIDNYANERQLKTSHFARKIKVFVNAVDALRDLHNDDLLPEYIFLDINMPFKNGFEFLDELLSMPKRYDGIKVVILTASNDSVDRLKAEEYPQIVAYLGKPLNQKHLLNLRMSIVKQKL